MLSIYDMIVFIALESHPLVYFLSLLRRSFPIKLEMVDKRRRRQVEEGERASLGFETEVGHGQGRPFFGFDPNGWRSWRSTLDASRICYSISPSIIGARDLSLFGPGLLLGLENTRGGRGNPD